MNKVLFALALLCFVLAVFNVEIGTVPLVPLGLALWVATNLTGSNG